MESTSDILLIRLKSIGDVVLTLPALSALRQNFPAAKITFLTSQENAGLLRGFRDVNEIIVINRAILRGGNPLKMVPELFHLLRRLRAGKFSLVADLQANGESAWLAWLTGARHRWAALHRSARRWAYTRSMDYQCEIHAAEMHLELLRHCGLETAGGLMQLAGLVVGGDTGALHLAVAQGRRVVMLMSGKWQGRPHPFRHPEWSLVPPVDQNIATIRLDSVIAACEAALG